MTKTHWLLSLVLVPALLLIGAPVKAAFATDELSVKVPFRFAVGTAILPAGNYEIRTSDVDPAVIWFTSPNGRHVAVAATEWGGGGFQGDHAELQFAVYGHTHFLSKIEVPGEDGRSVSLTKDEIALDLSRVAARRSARGKN
jgi:hypothetical protein